MDNATGEIEILVGLDGYDCNVIENDMITVLKSEEHIGRRKISNKLAQLSSGKYLFEIDAHCIISYGWDTRLKCVCDENTIVGCSVDSINEEKWEANGNRWVGGKITEDHRWQWDKTDKDDVLDKIEEVDSFNSCGWMIRRDYFEKLGMHNEELGEWGGENIEWTLKSDNNIIIRTDVVVAHLFRREYPYEIKGIEHDNLIEILNSKYARS